MFSLLMRLASVPVIAGGILMFRMPLRVAYLRLLGLAGGIGLRLFPSIYGSLDAQNVKYGSGYRVKEKYRDKEAFNSFLRQAEEEGISRDQISAQIEGEIAETIVLDTPLDQIFSGMDRENEVAVQYSGGCDSTLVSILAALYFRRVHLVSFHNSFILQKEKSELNARKLASVFGEDRVRYLRVNTSGSFRQLLFGEYFADLRKHKSFVLGVGCLACKLSFDIDIIRYCLEHNVPVVFDGADLSVRSQLSQGDEGVLRERQAFYSKYGIDFRHPAAKFRNNAYELYVLGASLDPPQIMYAEQPVCVGNQFLNEIYDRFYFLPKYGIERHSEEGLFWLSEKLALSDDLIKPAVDRGSG